MLEPLKIPVGFLLHQRQLALPQVVIIDSKYDISVYHSWRLKPAIKCLFPLKCSLWCPEKSLPQISMAKTTLTRPLVSVGSLDLGQTECGSGQTDTSAIHQCCQLHLPCCNCNQFEYYSRNRLYPLIHPKKKQ